MSDLRNERRPRRGTPRRKPRPANRWLERVEAVFLIEGYSRISVRELAARLRCSLRTLYELAPTKEDLFVLVVDGFYDRIRQQGERMASTTPDLAMRIERYLAPGIVETARASNTFFADIVNSPRAHRIQESHQRIRIEGLQAMVAEGVRRGIFRGFDPQLVAEVFANAYRGVSVPAFLTRANLSQTEAYAEVGRLLRHGLLHPDNGEPPKRTTSRPRRRQTRVPETR